MAGRLDRGGLPSGVALLLLAALTVAISCVGVVDGQEICPGCTEVVPAGDFTCEDQKRFGKCDAEWMIDGGYCEFSCGRCVCQQAPSASVDEGTSLLQPTPGVTADDTEVDQTADVNLSDILGAGDDKADDAVVEDGSLVQDDTLVQDDAPVQGDAFVEDDSLVQGDTVVEDDSLVQGDTVVEDDSLVQGDTLVEDDSLVQGDTVVEDDALVQNDATDVDAVDDAVVEDDAAQDATAVDDDSTAADDSTTAAEGDGAEQDAGEELVPLARLADEEGGCENTVFTAVSSASELTTLASLLEAAGLDVDLDDESLEVTLFAPTNKGFNKFARAQKLTVPKLTEDDMIDTTSTILQYHVATEVLESSDLETPAAIETLLQQAPLFGGSASEIEGLGSSAPIKGRAVRICNSIVYLVDDVLLPGATLEEIGGQPENTDEEGGKAKSSKCSPGVGPMFAISSDTNLSTFTEALNFAQISGGLATADEELTILAPTNDAFDEILERMNIDLPQLLADRDTLTGILEYHIIEQNLDKKSFGNGELEELDTMNGTVLLVENSGNKIEFAGTGTSATVIENDIDEACNAAVHKINAVLLPFELSTGSVVTSSTPDGVVKASSTKPKPGKTEEDDGSKCMIDMWQAINSSPDLTTLAQIMEFADVSVLLQNKDLEITLFAPSDTAWGALLPKGLGFFDLIPDVSVADALLSYHIIGAPVPTRAFSDGFELPTLLFQEDNPLSLTTLEKDPTIPNQFTLNGEVGSALFVRNDIIICKSVIHVIDTVLLPDKDIVTSPTGTKETAIETAEEFEAMIAVARDADSGADDAADAADDATEVEPARMRNNERTNG